jgi:hypothetical protein
MVKQTTTDKESSNIIWNNLEEMVPEGQRFYPDASGSGGRRPARET